MLFVLIPLASRSAVSIVAFLALLAASIWVAVDAASYRKRNGDGPNHEPPWGWLLACIVYPIVSIPVYLAQRRQPLS